MQRSQEYSDSSSDIAFLQLQGELPKQVAVANLSEDMINTTHTFQSFGFRRLREIIGLNAAGEIRGTVQEKSTNAALTPCKCS